MKKGLYTFLCISLWALLPLISAAQPAANFSANITSGCSPIVVQFSDQSTGSPTSWLWDLGNGVTSTVQNPSTTYINPGTYTVSLTATNAGGNNTKTTTGYITVLPSPVISFTADSSLGCPPKNIAFNNLTVAGGVGSATYLWDFGDGGSSSAVSPTHTYANSGNFNVTLLVTNSAGCSKTLTKPGYIPLLPVPVASFTATNNNSCTVPATVTFTNTSTNAVSFSWDFGDGTTSTQANPTKQYNNTGSYAVRLVAINAAGCSDTVIQTALVNLGSLNASFTASSTTACIGRPVTFTNTSTPGPGISTWDFGDGSPILTSTNATKTYNTVGTYTVRLVVLFNNCSDTITQNITVTGKPTGNFTANNTLSCTVPFTTQFTNTSIGATSYLWLFGDGTTSTQTSPSKTYNTQGTFTVKLISYNAGGCTDTFTRTDYIKIQTFNASLFNTPFPSPAPTCAPTTTTIHANSSTILPISSYSWNFGDGNTLNCFCPTPDHTYTTPGTFTISLTYNSIPGCSFTTTQNVTVGTKPTASFNTAPDTVCPNQAIAFTNSSVGATSYLWLFGDGDTSIISNPTKRYYKSGTFTVRLIARNNDCRDTMTIANRVVVELPTAYYGISRNCANRKQISFHDTSVGANTYFWNFGDGNTSNQSGSVTHTYTNFGSYITWLAVSNTATGCTDTFHRLVTVYPLPSHFASSDTTICRNESVSFTATPDTNGVLYTWYYGDGGSSNGLAHAISRQYNNSGVYIVKLVVTDPDGCKDSVVKLNHVHVGGPIATFTASPLSGCAPLNVTFTDASTVSGSTIANRTWTWGDGQTQVTTATSLQHVYNANDSFTVKLIITDANGCTDSMVKTKYVAASKPIVDFFTNDTSVCAGQVVSFTNLSGGLGISELWSFGDGNTSTAYSVSHVYAQVGNYTVKLVVTDANGCRDSVTKLNYVEVNPLVLSFAINDTLAPCPPFSANFTNTSAGLTTTSWNLGNGSLSSLANPSTVYTYPGVYEITLVGTNNLGCTDSVKRNVTVLGPTGTLSYNPIAGCAPLTVSFSSTNTNTQSYIWDMNNGITQTTTGSTFSYTYTQTGKYVPKLVLSDGASCLVPITGIDTVRVDLVDADFTFTPNSLCNTGLIQFTDTVFSSLSAVNSISWQFGDGGTSITHSPSHTYNAPGAYIVRMIIGNASGCLDTVIKTVNVHALPTVSAGNGQSICFGQSAAVQLQATGAGSYSWTPATGLSCINCPNPTANPTVTTTYIVTGTDANSCTDTGKVIVTVNQLPVVTASPNVTICVGNNTPLQAIGGTSYTWSPATGLSCTNCANPTATPNVTTTYMVTGVDANGCSDTGVVTVTVSNAPNVTASSNVSICAGSSIPLQAAGASSYTWSPATGLSCTNCASPTASPPVTTTYVVTGTSGVGCTDTGVVIVTVNPLPNVSGGPNKTICAGSNTTLQGTGAVSYTWSPSTGLSCTSCAVPTANPLTPTIYTVTGTDVNSCTNTANVTVTVNPLPTVTASPNITICQGNNTQLQATGGVSYAWSPATGLSCTNCANPVATPTATTTYTVTGTDANGCTDTGVVIVTVSNAPNVTASPNVAICAGGSTPLQAAGATTYTWSPATGLSCTNCANPTATPTVTTTYVVTGASGVGCSDTGVVIVTVNPVPNIGGGGNKIICTGGSTTLQGSGGVSYTWSPSPGLSCTNCASPTANPASTTTYTVTGTDANGCVNTAAVAVTVNPLPTISGGPDKVICAGAGTSLQATGGVSYTWTPSTGLSCTNCVSPTANPTTTTTYTVTGTDVNGCTNTATVTVTVNALPVISAGANKVICNGASTLLQATGATSYTWSPATGLSCTNCANPTANPTTTTIYTVTGINSNSCSNTATVTVTVNPLPIISGGPNKSICPGGSTSLQATGGVSYSWTPATGLSCTNCVNPTASPSTTTTYTVTGTDANGCVNTGTVTVTVNPLPTISGGGNKTICIGSSTTLQGSGGVSYTWSPSTGLSCSNCVSPIANPTTTTTYTVTGTDANGCVNTGTVIVTVNPLPTIGTGGNKTICIGASAQLQATGGTSYAWTPTTGLSCTTCPNPIANPAVTTTYTVTGTNAAGCSNTATATVTVNQLPVISGGANQSVCSGSPVQLQASGGTSYVWAPSAGLSCTNCANPVANPTATTTYTVTGTNANGCVNTGTVTVSVNSIPNVTATSNKTVICDGTSAQFQANGAASYSWSPAIGLSCLNCPNPVASPSSSVTYIVTGTTNGCSDTAHISLNVLPKPIITAGPDTAFCFGGSITLHATGATNFTWSPASGLSCTACADPVANPTVTTIYAVTGADANGCEATATATVTVHQLPNVNAGPDVDVCAGSTVQLQATGASSYTWAGTDLSCIACSNPLAAPLTSMIYTVTGIDQFGCSNSDEIAVTVIQKQATTVSKDDTLCKGESANLFATGGTSYIWSPATGLNSITNATPVATPDASTTYKVIIKQGNCFTDTANVRIIVENYPTVDAGPDRDIAAGSNVTLSALGTGISRYEWSPAATLSCNDCQSPVASPLTSTTYVVTAFTAGGCKAEDDVHINVTCSADQLFVANTFTPNGDGINDRFYPQGKGISRIKSLRIFSRWGQQIFEARDIPLNDPGYGWDGTYKSEPLKPDVFVYIINAVCESGDPVEFKGDISIVR